MRGYLSGHEFKAPAGRFVVKKDAVDSKQAVDFPIVSY
jgi:hypothetical protein